MMIKLWTRDAAKAGPADTYKGRYRIGRDGSDWAIVDLKEHRTIESGFATARAARQYVTENL